LMGDMAKGVKAFKKGLAEDDAPAPAPQQIDAKAEAKTAETETVKH